MDNSEAISEFGSYEKAVSYLKGEVNTYNQWVNGEVYGYVITKDGEEVDSCWGYYGYDHCEDEAKYSVDHIIVSERKEHFKKLKSWIRGKVPAIYRTSFS